MADEDLTEERLARARISVPDHVVYRSFDSETVVLNLGTGHYHGLNSTAGRMLDLLCETGSARLTAETLAREFNRPVEEIAGDVGELCRDLAARGLIEVGAGPVQ